MNVLQREAHSKKANLRGRRAEVGRNRKTKRPSGGVTLVWRLHASRATPARRTGGPWPQEPYMDCIVFFFCAGFLAAFFAVFAVFCAATAAVELITAVAGSSTAAPKAPIMTATIRCFIGVSIAKPRGR